jgi:hypothetical protein
LSGCITEDQREEVTPIIPLSRIVAPVVWNVDVDICRALRQEPLPAHCSEGHTYVPSDVRDHLLAWAHTAPVSGHPGIARTIDCLSAKCWWPTLAQDVQVSSCATCAQSNTPRHLPYGKIHPLPVHQQPWSHLCVDFVTDLPPSGHTTILVIGAHHHPGNCEPVFQSLSFDSSAWSPYGLADRGGSLLSCLPALWDPGRHHV